MSNKILRKFIKPAANLKPSNKYQSDKTKPKETPFYSILNKETEHYCIDSTATLPVGKTTTQKKNYDTAKKLNK